LKNEIFCFIHRSLRINPFACPIKRAPWFIKSFKQLKLNHKYELKDYLKPPYLEADFNGDGHTDIAILVDERRTKKKGILIIQDEGRQYFVFGACNIFTL